MKLGQKPVGAFDGSGDKLREKGDEQGIAAEAVFRPALSSRDIQDVSEGLKGIKGDPRRQEPGGECRVFKGHKQTRPQKTGQYQNPLSGGV